MHYEEGFMAASARRIAKPGLREEEGPQWTGEPALPAEEGAFFEFFCGGGMARLGLGASWRCRFANDFDGKKGAIYRLNFAPAVELHIGDVRNIEASQLPGAPDLVWASFPCQDLSLAGNGEGLSGERSGTFWPFWRLMRSLDEEMRPPKIIVLENVCGTLTSHAGDDFRSIASAFSGLGYRFGCVVIDARDFVPQSRSRLFIIGIRQDVPIPDELVGACAFSRWYPPALLKAHSCLSSRAASKWVWWSLPVPPKRNTVFADLIEEAPTTVRWHTASETEQLLGMMSAVNYAKVQAARRLGRRLVGGVYRRTRIDEAGIKRQRAEVRFDDVAGCLRTPAGGSSRQTILIVEGRCVRSRLLSPREAARLMGIPDDYRLPDNYNEAYHLIGDGVVVPVVRHLTSHLLEPLLRAYSLSRRAA
jgi:DNA (cytosine-5)-methyltransferase 1